MKESPEIVRDCYLEGQIETQTQRVISDHLPTIYAVEKESGSSLGEPYESEKVAKHIRSFFYQVDLVIDQAGKILQSPPEVQNEFRLMFRRLYTVTNIQAHIMAVEEGQKTALKITGGKPEKIYATTPLSHSGHLFLRNMKLGFANSPCVNLCTNNQGIEAILITDDVSHSGSQIAQLVLSLKAAHPMPIVISLGAITTRAQDFIRQYLNPSQDLLIAQELKLSLEDMIGKIKPEKKHEQLLRLAQAYFQRQGVDVAKGMQATHVITPFKLPDDFSNGELSVVKSKSGEITFALRRVNTYRDRYYPEVF